MVHFDNAAPHWLAATENYFQGCQFRHAPQSPDSPDISPYDFFLFGDLKMKLKYEELERMDEMQDRVKESLGRITSETMWRADGHWIGKLNQVMHTGGSTAKVNYPDISFTSEEYSLHGYDK
jgi:hypothetical protein